MPTTPPGFSGASPCRPKDFDRYFILQIAAIIRDALWVIVDFQTRAASLARVTLPLLQVKTKIRCSVNAAETSLKLRSGSILFN